MAESTLNLRITGDDAEAMKVMLRMTQQQLKMAQSMRDIGTESGKAGRKIEDMGGPSKVVADNFLQIGRGAVGMVSGLASLPAAIGMLKQYSEYLGRIRETQTELSNRGLLQLRLAAPLAEQMGDVSAHGLRRAMAAGGQVAIAAGAPLDVGLKAVHATLSNIRTTNQTDQTAIATALATSIAKTGGGPEEVASLAELFGAAGFTTPAQVTGGLAKIQGALLSSPALGVGTFGQAATKAVIPMMSLGASMEQGLQLYAQARQVSGGSEDAAAELLNQVTRVMMTDQARKVIQRQRRLAPQQAKDLPLMERFGAMGEAIQAAQSAGRMSTIEDLVRDLPPRQRMQVIRMFSPGARQTGEVAREMMGRFGAAELESEHAAWRQTPIAGRYRTEARIAVRDAESARQYASQAGLQLEGKQRLEEARARGDIFWDTGWDWLRSAVGEPRLADRYAGQALAQRLGLPPGSGKQGVAELKRFYGIPSDLTPESVSDLPPAAQRRVAASIHEAQLMGQMPRGEQGRQAPVVQHFYGDVYDFAGRRDLTKPGENAPSVGLD